MDVPHTCGLRAELSGSAIAASNNADASARVSSIAWQTKAQPLN